MQFMVYRLSHVEKGAGPHSNLVWKFRRLQQGYRVYCSAVNRHLWRNRGKTQISRLNLLQQQVRSSDWLTGTLYKSLQSKPLSAICSVKLLQSQIPLYFPFPPAGALQLQRVLYKSPCFLQNKPNFKMGKMTISTATPKAYANEQRTMNNERYSKQSQTKPISNGAPTLLSVVPTLHATSSRARMKPRFLNFCSKNSLTGFLDSVEY